MIETLEPKISEMHLIVIAPEDILGFRPGMPLDFDLYDRIGLRHPKSRSYYDFVSTSPNSSFMKIANGITASEKFNDNILVFPIDKDQWGSNYAVLDGATRMSSAAMCRIQKPNSFKTVSAVLFTGTKKEAAYEMVRRNLEGVKRNLTWSEMLNAFERLLNYSYTHEEIVKSLHLSANDVKNIARGMHVRSRAVPSVMAVLDNGLINVEQAFNIASRPSKQQEVIIEKIISGEVSNKKWSNSEVSLIVKAARFTSKQFKSIESERMHLEHWMSVNEILSPEILHAFSGMSRSLRKIKRIVEEKAKSEW